jgi:hypothetical protein
MLFFFMMIEISAHQLTRHRYRAVQSIVRLPADAHDDLVCSFHSPCSLAMQQLCSLYSLHLNGPPTSAGKIMEDIAAAPGVPLAKALFKSAPSLIFGHGALSMLLARISKNGVPQVSVKGFLQQFVPAVAVLTPAILVPKITQIVAQGVTRASPTVSATSATTQPPSRAPKATMVSSAAAKTSQSVASISSSADSKPGLTRARATFRKLIRARRPSSVDVLRMLGVSTSLYPSALSAHEASGKSSLLHLLKTSSVSSMPLQLSGMWPSLKSILPCSVFDLRVIDAKFVPSAGALYTSVNRKVRVTFCNGTDSFFGSLATVSAKSHRGDDHSWDFPSAQVPTIKNVFTYFILTCTRRF